MAVKTILLLGNPLLNQRCDSVIQNELPAAVSIADDLRDTLMDFRAKHGWGRAIAAPQIGVLKRVVYLHLEKPWLLINPAPLEMSEEKMELWDDCMSFPDLLVRVKRHRKFSLSYYNEQWIKKTLAVDGILSELLQHELDHLDGVLAVARALNSTSFALRSQKHLLTGTPFANA